MGLQTEVVLDALRVAMRVRHDRNVASVIAEAVRPETIALADMTDGEFVKALLDNVS